MTRDEIAALRALADAGPDDAAVEAAASALAKSTIADWDYERLGGQSAEEYFAENWRDWIPEARAALAAAFKTMGR